jgi:hypothetical protein
MHEVIKDLVKLSELLKSGSRSYGLANSIGKEQIMKIIFSELFISGNTLTYQCKNGFKALQNRFSAVCDQTGWISEALQIDNSIKTSIEAMELFLPHQPAGP